MLKASEENLKKYLAIVENEYRLEDARRAGIVTRDGMFLQFSGVLTGLSVARLAEWISNANAFSWEVVLYLFSIVLSVISVVLLAISLNVRGYKRFSCDKYKLNESTGVYEGVNIEEVKASATEEYLESLINTYQDIVPHNQNLNTDRLRLFNASIWLCTAAVVCIVLPLCSNVLSGVKVCPK